MNLYRVRWSRVLPADREMVLASIPVGQAVTTLPWDTTSNKMVVPVQSTSTLSGNVIDKAMEFERINYGGGIVWIRRK